VDFFFFATFCLVVRFPDFLLAFFELFCWGRAEFGLAPAPAAFVEMLGFDQMRPASSTSSAGIFGGTSGI